jgi:hypothetical protein
VNRQAKCRRANARPEPDFRYFLEANRAAFVRELDGDDEFPRHVLDVCGHRPALCHSSRRRTFAVMPM